MIPRWVWVAWLWYVLVGTSIAVAWFGIAEALAIRNGISGDTLSEFVWSHHVPAVLFIMFGGTLIGLIVWLLWMHFPSGGRWGV